MKQRNARGFTLIELLMVIAIIGVLAALIIVSIVGAQNKAKDTSRKNNNRAITSALSQYYLDNKDKYPAAPIATDLIEDLTSSSNLYAAIVTSASLIRGSAFSGNTLAAKYSSNGDGSAFVLGSELANATEATIQTGNGVYQTDPYAPGLFSSPTISGAIKVPSPCSVNVAPDASNSLAFTSGGFSISVWAYLTTLSGNPIIVAHTNAASTTGYYLWYSSGGGQLRLTINGVNFGYAGAITVGQWNHIVATYSGNVALIYVNGVGNSGALVSGSPTATGVGLSVGNSSAGAFNCLNGSVDDLRLYNLAMTNVSGSNAGVNIPDLYNAGKGIFGDPNQTGLAGGWRFDEMTGSVAKSYKTSPANDFALGVANPTTWSKGLTSRGLYGLNAGTLYSNHAFITYGPQ